MPNATVYEFWFITGSQHLYGPETLRQVDSHSREIADFFDRHSSLPHHVVCKPVLTTPEAIGRLFLEANSSDACAGLIAWMHTFSPAKMWIAGLSELRKPLLHLHTQYNRDIPWDSIDMDFMNLNQSAHGDREFGFICSRMNVKRKVIAGHWKNPDVIARVADWMNTARAFMESRALKIARFGDNMRDVAVTEGDKVEAQVKFGWSVNGYGLGDVAAAVKAVTDDRAERLMREYEEQYEFPREAGKAGPARDAIREQARMEIGMQAFLEGGGFGAFTTTFENLAGLPQLPGLAVQRLMAKGYGFGAEGDWKTAGIVRLMKIMSGNRGTSFMEDYTYHLEPGREMILGAHMLEVCPSLSSARARVEVHPLSIGGKADPARLVFDGDAGRAVCVSLIDLGNRFRLIVNEVESVKIEKPMPKLPVARVVWKPLPSFRDSTESWILAGGAHHTCFSLKLTAANLEDWADMTDIECLVIGPGTTPRSIGNQLRINEVMRRS
ncbi:MAG: L-arabinose isomerase [Spirochaetales bacterium]|nr:L-arabinose isomerase [Spirochaetales bacterium]